jgi:hypothetical protein
MADKPLRPLLDPWERGSDERINRVVDAFALRRTPSVSGAARGNAHWDAAFYGLERVQRFSGADPAVQRQVLDACGEHLLWESYYIEQCGIAFCARMVLLAEDVPTRKLYSLIGGDEATHEHWLAGWLQHSSSRPPDPFNLFIAALVEGGEPQPLNYVLQIVLEGFGIQHYRSLAHGCREPALATTLRTMMSDEGTHHAGGVAAFDAGRLDRHGRTFALEATSRLLEMIRIGPQAVVAVLARTAGGLDGVRVEHLFDALGCEADSAAKLAALRKLIAQPGMDWLVQELERLRLFTPCSPVECARAFASAKQKLAG